eukprot:TRINITY_DN4568_c0_g2_i1.p1 TRINITY_DN4568_c0_g2~~TRINITY_DN4568_c0_g2_i1.p1  ORF type:complete len:604 (+),score=95.98 TRINITY_DN4568_c0_g2_i1:56-1813(+)
MPFAPALRSRSRSKGRADDAAGSINVSGSIDGSKAAQVHVQGGLPMPAPREQVEFYFSAKNIPGDTYLRSRMDSSGWVLLEEIVQFPRMLALGMNVEGVASALADSATVEVSTDRLRVRIRCPQLRAACPWVRWSGKAAHRSRLVIQKALKQRLKQFAASKRAKKSTRSLQSAEGLDFIPLGHSTDKARGPRGVIAKAPTFHMAGTFVKASAAHPISHVASMLGAKGKAASAAVSLQAPGALCKSAMAAKCAVPGLGISSVFGKAPCAVSKAGTMLCPFSKAGTAAVPPSGMLPGPLHGIVSMPIPPPHRHTTHPGMRPELRERPELPSAPAKLAGNNWEESREQKKLGLLGEGSPPEFRWTYPLEDESRRSFVGLVKGVLTEEQSRSFFFTIKDGANWQQPQGTNGLIPRKTCWMVRQGCECRYRYGGLEVEPQVFPGWMQELMQIAMKPCGILRPSEWPNSCNLNLYEDGGMTVGWHSDDEKLFQGKFNDCRIISLSFGATRNFELRLNWPEDHEKPHKRIVLQRGDLLTMEGMMQKHFQHRVPREDMVSEPRINLTWRWVKRHDPKCPAGHCRAEQLCLSQM